MRIRYSNITPEIKEKLCTIKDLIVRRRQDGNPLVYAVEVLLDKLALELLQQDIKIIRKKG